MLILQVDLSQLSNEELDAQEQAFLGNLSNDELNALELQLAPSPAATPAPLTAESMQRQFDSTIPKERPGLIERMDASVEGMLDKIHPYKSGDKITDLAGLADQSARAIQHGVIMGIPKAIAGIPDMFKAVAYDPTRSLVQALNGQVPDKGPTELLANLAPLVGAAKFGLPGLMGGAKAGQLAQTGEVGTLPENLQAGTEVLVGGKSASAANKALGDPVSRFNAKVEAAKGMAYPERIKQAYRAEGTSPSELKYLEDVKGAKGPSDTLAAEGGEVPARVLLRPPKGADIGKDSAAPYESLKFLRDSGEFQNIPNDRLLVKKIEGEVGGRTKVDTDGSSVRDPGRLGKQLEDYAYEASTKQKQAVGSGKNDTRTTALQMLDEIKTSLEDRSGEFINREVPINSQQAFEGKIGNPGEQSAVRQSYKDAEVALRKMVSDNVKKKYAILEETGPNNQPITRGWKGPKDDSLISNWDDVLAEQPLNAHNLFRYRINLGEQIRMNKISGPARQPAAIYDKAVYDAIGEAEARGFEVDPALKAKYEDAKTKFSHYKNIQRWLDEGVAQGKRMQEGGEGSQLGRVFGASIGPQGIWGRISGMFGKENPRIGRDDWRRSMVGHALATGENVISGGDNPLSMRDLAHISVPDKLGMMASSVTGNPAVQGAMMGGAGMSGLATLRTPPPELPPLPSDYDKMVNLMNGKPELRAQYDALVLSKDPAAKAQMRTFITQLLQEDSNKKVLGAARGGFSPVEAYKASIEAFKSSFRGVMGNP